MKKRMKTTLGVAADAAMAVQQLANENQTDVFFQWKLEDLNDVLKKFAKRFSEAHSELIKQYGLPKEGTPGQYTVPGDKVEEFQNKIAELSEHEVEFTCDTIDIVEFDGREIKLDGKQFRALKNCNILVNKTEEKKDKKQLKKAS